MEDLVSMFAKLRRLTVIISLSLVLFVSWSSLVFGTEKVNVCNQGDVEVFYASLGVRENFMSTSAKIQGLFSIDPGTCRDVLPGGMSDVTVAFFYRDRSGTFGNTVFKVKGPEESLFRTKLSQICVNLEGFRDNSTRDHLSLSQFIKIWTPPCLQGYFPAKTSFGVWEESDYIYTIDISPSRDTLVAPIPPLPENEIKTFDDGARNERHLRNDVPHGKGKITWPDGRE
jgi:hypothetical protein